MKYKTSQNEKKVNWDAEILALVARASSLLTLLFYQIEPLKNGASLILPSSIAKNSYEP